jgi:predicted nucleic acid-binding protein
VFLDTNVLVSALGTRGLCADLLRVIVDKHDLVTGEVVIEELGRVLARKFGTPAEKVIEVENFLRGFHVEPEPRNLLDLDLSGRNDLMIVGSAINARAEILVTGDREILAFKKKPRGLRIVSPRECWNLTTRATPRKRPRN